MLRGGAVEEIGYWVARLGKFNTPGPPGACFYHLIKLKSDIFKCIQCVLLPLPFPGPHFCWVSYLDFEMQLG